jgi:hypothetical protein
MADSKTAGVQYLEELRRERDELNMLIQALERRLSIASSSQESETAPIATNTRVGALSYENIPVGFFHNMTQAAAVEKLLRLNPNHALKSGEIMEALKRSGMEFTSKNALTILYTTLKRSSKFERVAGKAWGLAEWYPEKRKRKEAEAGTESPQWENLLKDTPKTKQ